MCLTQQLVTLLRVAGGKQAGIQCVESGRAVIPVIVGLGEIAQIKWLHMADDRQIVIFLTIYIAEPLGPLHALDFDRNAHLRQHGGDDFSSLFGIRRRRQFHRKRQLTNASLLQQGFGLFRVIRRDACGIDISRRFRHVKAANGYAQAVCRTLNHCLTINSHADGAAHPHIIQGFATIVHGHDGFGARCSHQYLETVVAFELLQITRHLNACKQINITRQQRGRLRSGIRNEAECSRLQRNIRSRAIALPFFEGERSALLPVLQLIRAGSYRGRIVVCS